MPLLVSDVIAAVSTDVRKVLQASPDSALMIDWVNRINKKVMHSSIYNNELRATVNVPLTANTNIYTVSFTNLRRVLSAFDNTAKRPLTPLGESIAPLSNASPGNAAGGAGIYGRQAIALGVSWPEFYSQWGASGFGVWPAPPVASNLGVDVVYEQVANDLTATSDTVQCGTDGKDAMVAGVNMMAFSFLKRPEDVAFWSGEFMNALKDPGVS